VGRQRAAHRAGELIPWPIDVLTKMIFCCRWFLESKDGTLIGSSLGHSMSQKQVKV